MQPGDALAPLREAAEAWGVNVHTVRHAYTSLARDGLLETHRGARGTRVARDRRRSTPDHVNGRSREAFLDAVRRGHACHISEAQSHEGQWLQRFRSS